MWIKSLLSENSEVSCMRFMSVVALLFSGILACGIFFGKDTLSICSLFLGAAFAGKAVQKFGEK